MYTSASFVKSCNKKLFYHKLIISSKLILQSDTMRKDTKNSQEYVALSKVSILQNNKITYHD